MAKPVTLATWATDGGALVTNPGASKQAQGWVVEKPPVQYMNWWKNLVGQWVAYFDTQIDSLIALQGIYDAIVGAGGTHADLNAVVADMGVGIPATNVKVFVKSAFTATATQVLNKEGIEIEFHPTASFAKGVAVVTGIQVDAKRIKITKGRFLNFDEVGGKAIEMTANAKNCHVSSNTFDNCTDEIEDNGTNNSLTANLVEVA